MDISKSHSSGKQLKPLLCVILFLSLSVIHQNLWAVEPESSLYSDQAEERTAAYKQKEEYLQGRLKTATDEKESKDLELQLEVLTKLNELPEKPEKPSIDLRTSELKAQDSISWQEAEQYFERYISVLHESKIAAQNIENSNKEIQDLYNKLIAMDVSHPESDRLQLQHAYQIRRLTNQVEIDKQLRLALNKAREQYPKILKRIHVDQSMINDQRLVVSAAKQKLDKPIENTKITIAGDDALIQQQESLLAGYLGHDLSDNESRIMHYEQLKLLKFQVQRFLHQSQLLEGQVTVLEAAQKVLWLQLFGDRPDFFKLADKHGDLAKELEGIKETLKKNHYQVYSREKELSTLRGGNALIGPKAEELISSLDQNIREIFTSMSGYDQRLALLDDKGGILKKAIDLKQSALGSMVTKTREATDNLFEKVMSVLKFPLLSYSGMSISLLLLLEVVGLLILGILVNRLYGLVISRMGGKRNWSERTIHLVQAVGKYPFIFIVAMVILSVVGINTSSLALIAGALSVGIGFGMQTIVNNLVSGIILLFDKSIRPGDFISLGSDTTEGGFRGSVTQMNIRATVLRTNDNISIIIPNADLMASQVVNWTYADEKIRFRVPFSVAYGTDLDEVKAVISKAVGKLAMVLNHPEPQVWLAKHGESSLDFLAAVWVEGQAARQPARTFDAVLSTIYKTLNSHGIEIPFPQVDLHMRSHTPQTSTSYDFIKLAN